MNIDMFNLKDGQLTNYSLRCGYVQSDSKDNKKVELYHDGCYHIRGFDGIHRVFWDSFEKLGDARKHYKMKKKEFLK